MVIDKEKNVINDTEKFIRYISIFVGIVVIIVLIILKINYPSFKIWALLISILGVILFFVGIYYIMKYISTKNADKKLEEERIPRPISLEQAREIAKNSLKSPEWADYAIDCLGEDVQQRGKTSKNDIYISKWKGYYSADIVYILINMNYPNIRRTIKINPNEKELEIAKMYLANEELVPTKETKIVNPVLGIEQTISEPQKEDKKDKKEEDKDL